MTLPEPGEALRLVRKGIAAMPPSEYQDALFETAGPVVPSAEPDPVLDQSGWTDLMGGMPSATIDQAVKPLDLIDRKVPLDAYLASALTGLNADQRQHVFLLSHVVSQACANFGINLYEPRNVTDPVHNADVLDSVVWHTDRDRVLATDLLIHLAHLPSTGSGQELSFAYEAMVPIIVVSQSESRVSRMVTGIPGIVISVSYSEPEELTRRLAQVLFRIRPMLVQRRLALETYNANIVGERIRELREAAGLSRRDIEDASGDRCPIPAELLRTWEVSTDRSSNMSLVQLRELAFLLKVSVADIVEPDFGEVVLSALGRYVSSQAARGHVSASDHDRRALVRRVLVRALEALED